MTEIPRSVIDAFTEQLDMVIERHRRGLAEALARIDMDADVATVRDQVVAAMQVWCGGASDMSAMIAAEFYDGLRELCVGEPMGALVDGGRAPEATEGAVRAFVQDLVEGKAREVFVNRCLDRLDYEAKRAAAECVVRNAARDRAEVRFARVPTGAETCDFCVMLASRGPVYHSEASAGAVTHFHANCDCKVVPMWDTVDVGPSRRMSLSTTIEGYDPDALYERYVQAMTSPKFREAVARTGHGSGHDTSHPMLWAEAKRAGLVTLGSVGEVQSYIKAATSYDDLFERIEFVSKEWPHYGLSETYRREMQDVMRRTRDRLLGGTGEHVKPVAIYEKPRGALLAHERKGVDWLLENGIVPTVRQEDPKALANFDFEIDGTPWEMKNVTNAGSSLKNQLGRAKAKWRKLGSSQPVNIVITTDGCTDDFDAVVEAVRAKGGYNEVIVISESRFERIKQ